jgi:biopolymer transport protein ExbD
MAITRPGPRLGASIPLSFVRAAKSGRKRVDASIALIPFIDFMLCVVVFLLMTFSTSPDSAFTADLPEATNGAALTFAPVISVVRSVVTVEGRRVIDTPTHKTDARLDRVEGIVTNLVRARESWELLHPEEPFPGRVIVQVDRAVDFRAVRKVLFSAGQAGYPDVDLAVRSSSGS